LVIYEGMVDVQVVSLSHWRWFDRLVLNIFSDICLVAVCGLIAALVPAFNEEHYIASVSVRLRGRVGRVFRFVLALQFVLGVLQLLDVVGVVYHPHIHRVSYTETFSVGFDLFWPLMLLLVAWAGYYVVEGYHLRPLVLCLLVAGFLDLRGGSSGCLVGRVPGGGSWPRRLQGRGRCLHVLWCRWLMVWVCFTTGC